MTGGADCAALVFIELGAILIGLAISSRVANHFGFSAIPLYLLAGLAFGNGGLAPSMFRRSSSRSGRRSECCCCCSCSGSSIPAPS